MSLYIDLASKIPVIVLLLLSACGVIGGDYLAKLWSQNPSMPLLISVFVVYFFSGFFYIPTLLRNGLVVTSLMWNLFSLIGFLFIGLVLFNEQLTTLQTIGVALGALSLVLLNI